VAIDFGALHSFMNGEQHTTNEYYPSREMHEDAYAALAPVLARLT